MPVNTSPAAPTEAPSRSDPPAGSPVAVAAAPIASPVATQPTVDSRTAARSGACRPTRAERISSVRPVSSSPRVCRTVVNMAMSAATRTTEKEISNAIAPATVSSPTGGPASAMVAGLLPTEAR
jgi:hypothetical protein